MLRRSGNATRLQQRVALPIATVLLVIIFQRLDVIKTADWLVDLGPEGGSGGGEIIATGTPEQVAKIKKSHTGRFLKETLA